MTSILGNPGAVSWVDKMFVVNVYCKIEMGSSRSYSKQFTTNILSTRLTAPGSLRMYYKGSAHLLNEQQGPGAGWCLNLLLNHTVKKDSRGVLGTSFRFGPTSEILENIQYGGSSVVEN